MAYATLPDAIEDAFDQLPPARPQSGVERREILDGVLRWPIKHPPATMESAVRKSRQGIAGVYDPAGCEGAVDEFSFIDVDVLVYEASAVKPGNRVHQGRLDLRTGRLGK